MDEWDEMAAKVDSEIQPFICLDERDNSTWLDQPGVDIIATALRQAAAKGREQMRERAARYMEAREQYWTDEGDAAARDFHRPAHMVACQCECAKSAVDIRSLPTEDENIGGSALKGNSSNKSRAEDEPTS